MPTRCSFDDATGRGARRVLAPGEVTFRKAPNDGTGLTYVLIGTTFLTAIIVLALVRLTYDDTKVSDSRVFHRTGAAQRYRAPDHIVGGGVHAERGYGYYDMEGTELRRTMTEAAKDIIVAADHSKFGKDLLVSLGPLETASSIVTDRVPDRAMQTLLRQRKVKLVVAPPDEPDR